MSPQEHGHIVEKQSNPKDPKVLITHCIMYPNGNCDFKIDTSNLNPEQLAKTALGTIRALSSLAFQKINHLVDGVAYTTRLPIPENKNKKQKEGLL